MPIFVNMCYLSERDAKKLQKFLFSLRFPVSAPLALYRQPSDDPEKNQVHLPGETATAYRMPDGTVHCVPRTVSPPEYRTMDLPRINYRYNGLKYQYAYLCRFDGTIGNAERVSDEDLRQMGQDRTYWVSEKNVDPRNLE